MRILLLTNSGVGLYKLRRELLEAILVEHDVYITFPKDNFREPLEKLGCKYIESHINRHGTNPMHDSKLLAQYIKILKEVKPAAVLSFTIKPNIYGGIACRLLRTPYIATITGLSMAIEHGGWLRHIVLFLYRMGFKGSNCVFFQNRSNMRFFSDTGIAYKNNRLVSGSGVNLQHFTYAYYPSQDKLRFLFIGRFLRDKGVLELLEAAKQITASHTQVEFLFVGIADEPGIQAQINQAVAAGIILYLPFQEDVRPCISQCHALVLPSYHEGMANVLLEASAMGRPVIASEVPGCQEAFEDGVTGFAVKPKNSADLVEKIQTFIALPYEKKAEMGRRARQKMEREFDRTVVVEAYLEEVEKIVGEEGC